LKRSAPRSLPPNETAAGDPIWRRCHFRVRQVRPRMALHANTSWIGSSPAWFTKKVRKMNLYAPPPPKNKSQARPDHFGVDDPAVFVFASWSRALTGARPENKLRIFAAMAEGAVTYLDVHRQQVVDDLWLVAEEAGLVDLLGAVAVQDALTLALQGRPF
jgi:hypothetical protein